MNLTTPHNMHITTIMKPTMFHRIRNRMNVRKRERALALDCFGC
jgi:hypothetical protein